MSAAAAAGAAGFERPRALDAALALLAGHAARGVRPVLLAGGTDWMVERHLAPPGPAPGAPVIDLTAVPELAAIERSAGPDGAARFVVGAGVPYLAFRTHAALRDEVPMLAAMAREVGAVQIQARGTLGGNLATASPAADGVCALAGLGAEVELASTARGRRAVPVAAFFTGYKQTVMQPDELITAVRFAAPGPHWFWRKVGTRLAQAISKVALAATARLDAGGVVREAHLGMASVAPVTATLARVRDELVGRRPADVSAARLAAALRADVAPIDDVRSTAEYRAHVAERLVAQFVASLGPSAAPSAAGAARARPGA